MLTCLAGTSIRAGSFGRNLRAFRDPCGRLESPRACGRSRPRSRSTPRASASSTCSATSRCDPRSPTISWPSTGSRGSIRSASGASARFRLASPGVWFDTVIDRVERPHLVREQGTAGARTGSGGSPSGSWPRGPAEHLRGHGDLLDRAGDLRPCPRAAQARFLAGLARQWELRLKRVVEPIGRPAPRPPRRGRRARPQIGATGLSRVAYASRLMSRPSPRSCSCSRRSRLRVPSRGVRRGGGDRGGGGRAGRDRRAGVQRQLTRFLNPDDNEDSEYLVGHRRRSRERLPGGVPDDRERDRGPAASSADLHRGRTRSTTSSSRWTERAPTRSRSGPRCRRRVELPLPDSTAATGPNQGALLIFLVDDEVSENRPLKLEIETPTTSWARSSSTSRPASLPLWSPAGLLRGLAEARGEDLAGDRGGDLAAVAGGVDDHHGRRRASGRRRARRR